MTPHLQLFRHDPQNGVYGDCWRTCVACLLDVEPSDLPHEHREMEGPEARALLHSWLEPRGLVLIEIGFPGTTALGDLLASMVHVTGGGTLFMASGQSARGTNHIVVASCSGVVHDPHPEGGGLAGPMDDGNWWISFIGKVV